MHRIAIIDTYYPEVIKAIPLRNGSYRDELLKVLDKQFGTSSFYSMHLRQQGWDAIDIIANHRALQDRWFTENDWDTRYHSQLSQQIEAFNPDVVFLQDLSIGYDSGDRVVAAQCSCPWPGDEAIKRCDVICTSFPHYVDRIQKLGVKAYYVPLAFEPSVLDKEELEVWSHGCSKEVIAGRSIERQREIDVAFVGGVGTPSHWSAGMKLLEKVAEEIPTACFYGYGYDLLPSSSPIRKKYKGPAWGRDMYQVLQRSKIVINRHGEVAQGYANNMRLYEATGCSAMLLTEDAPNLNALFPSGTVVPYFNPSDAVAKIRHYLAHDDEREAIAKAGQAHTLENHTYEKRMKHVSDILKAHLN